MASADDQSADEPPPLENCSEYMHSLLHSQTRLTAEKTRGKNPTEARIRDTTSLVNISQQVSPTLKVVPSTEDPTTPSTTPVSYTPFKKGFLTSKPSSKVKGHSATVPFLKAAKPAEKVPEFLRLDLKDDPEAQLRKEMQELLKPTQELVSEVLSNKEIQAGLEDPEIMTAVQDIASNPSAMHKYKHHPKIVKFYNSMGKLMGDRIEKQEEAKNKRETSKRSKC
ncbi:hypothetical protein MPTK1_4g19590 [Marchantia polymorpha subsp. ruderalis]|uniref:STI1/HOP DP domain-containing protein n=2 Tax=Marchantia polymorpha TaxID=3197 RepID=A0AAF6BBN0_MARPO|nr:hypothetical protein MARPO_0126s0035 [Marchantia polymorpha]BBN09414.1 hypothetical protein Mp_4g19590 [Marchantia polymorpha subsp. ruderalis]|eukprot:PTQ30328.1 hypothetical protein MARPO_0126s0035 [Marchantia polymorpha]